MEVSQMNAEGKNGVPTHHLEIDAEGYARVRENLEQANLALNHLGSIAPEVLQPRIALIRRIVITCETDLAARTVIVNGAPA